eukprot:481536-Amorphochlora_amoeboformis.AAC.1
MAFDDIEKSIFGSGKRIAVIGAGGYVGTALYDHLSHVHTVVGYDRNPRIPSRQGIIVHKSADEIPDETLHSFDVVVFLGGFTGRKVCDRHPTMVYEENVETPMRLASRMKSSQTLIFASTSAITEGSGMNPYTEADKVHEEQLDSYSASMYTREKELKRLSQTHPDVPQLIGVRFGTVVGHSEGQRVDMVHMALVKSAYTNGVLTVTHGSTNRAFLSLKDLVRALGVIIRNPEKSARFEIFHLKSYNGNIAAVANEVAMQTGSRTVAKDLPSPDTLGFSLNSDKFERRYNFVFHMSEKDVVADIIGAIPESVIAKGAHQGKPLEVGHHVHNDSMPCPVCGSYHLQETLDLHKQPLANDFRSTSASALDAPRFKLKLVRCKVCNHLFLSTAVDRSHLFSKYLYKSGTSRTLAKYFEWLAGKVASEAPAGRKRNGKVLEIASNDGSQLDKFKDIGWDTYGVDPAANIVPISVEKGHKAVVGFWGMENFTHIPSADKLDAIVAQNVFAHVPNPVDFLTACRKHMGMTTKLYIQTSQCQMHQK